MHSSRPSKLSTAKLSSKGKTAASRLTSKVNNKSKNNHRPNGKKPKVTGKNHKPGGLSKNSKNGLKKNPSLAKQMHNRRPIARRPNRPNANLMRPGRRPNLNKIPNGAWKNSARNVLNNRFTRNDLRNIRDGINKFCHNNWAACLGLCYCYSWGNYCMACDTFCSCFSDECGGGCSECMIPTCACPDEEEPPYCDGVWIPNDPNDNDNNGPGLGCGILPDEGYLGEPDEDGDNGDVDPEVQEEIEELGADALDVGAWQETRYLRVSNITKDTVTLSITYEVKNVDGEWAWLPDDEAVTVEIEAGAVVDLEDNDWRINARRVKFTCKSENNNWNRFQDKAMWVVPETDEEGNHGYSAPDIETFLLVVR